MQLNPADAGALAQIRQAVRQHIRADALRSMCEAIAQQVEETSLPFTYAGILLASGDRIGDAIEMLRLPPDLPFNQVLADYLEARQDFQPATTTFQQTAPYDIWTRTTIYQNYLDSTLTAFEAFARRTPPPGDQACPTLVDIGPGNGVLLVAMIKRLHHLYRLDQLEVVLIEQSPQMLEAAERLCKQSFSFPITVTPFSGKIEQLSPQGFQAIEEKKPIWFINASLSLHHMPREIKLPTLTKLASLGAPCFLADANGNHDSPDQDSPELIYSVTKSYGSVVQDTLGSPLTAEEKKLCIDHFILAEAITILGNDRSNRGDYHALIPEWQAMAHLAGWTVSDLAATSQIGETPYTFAMQLHPQL